MTRKERTELRRVFADYVASEGCSCCRNDEKHDAAAARLGKLLGFKKFPDGDHYNFYRYRSKEK